MKLTDSEKKFMDIEEMPIKKKHELILEIKKSGFKYNNYEIHEIIKDKWVFLQNEDDSNIIDIDIIIFNWNEAEELRIEKEQAKSGNTVIDKYFKKYGTLSKKDKPKDGYLYSQTVYFDGKATPGHTWNSEVHMYRLGVYKINSMYQPSYVKFYADMKVEDLIEAKMNGNIPTLRHCHNWYTSPHKNSINHYSHDNWMEDIQTAKNLFIKEIKNMLKDCESIQYNSKKDIYIAPENCVLWFEEKADHNGDETAFKKSKIYGSKKYKDEYGKSASVPAKFDRIVNKEEILELATKYCEEKLHKHNFRKEFKY